MATKEALADVTPAADTVLDFLGIGFGPSNLALAVAAHEIDPSRRGLFFDQRPVFDWHPGMLFESSRMQISFLKDLVTLRDPASKFSFLQYVKAKGRLEHFVNLNEWHPTRHEYRDYLRWVAEEFSDRVRYGHKVCKVSLAPPGIDGRHQMFKVDAEDLASGALSSHWTRNIVYAAGGTPRFASSVSAAARQKVIHSSEFLYTFPSRFPDRDAALRLGVVGNGQSAGEIVAYLLQNYPNVRIDLIISGYALRPADSSLFANEAFFQSEMEAFNASSNAKRTMLRHDLHNTNYGVVAPELIAQIYHADYQDCVRGTKRLFVKRYSKLASTEPTASGIVAMVEDRETGQTTAMAMDAVVLATGYDRRLDPEIFGELLPLIRSDEAGHILISEHCRVGTQPQVAAGLYAQGYGEASHGLAETLLSLLPFRSRDIFNQICGTRDGEPESETGGVLPTTLLRGGEYPPKRHLEHDPERLYTLLERCPFATLVSAEGDVPTITHLPLILDRSKGRMGILFGHLDRANPHVALLDGRPLLAVFHGPNAYISPNVYEEAGLLPTWNSMSVHVRGTVRFITTGEALVRGLASISALDTRPDAYRLGLDHPSIGRILNFIVGFEIEITEMVGRFKLSQDRQAGDQRRAAYELARNSEVGERSLIEQALGYALEPQRAPMTDTPSHSVARRAPEDCCLHELVEPQVDRDAGANAVIADEGAMTYGELNSRANQLAHHLRELGAGPDVLVGMCIERSPAMLVALLGILKAGAAFVPLDPEAPAHRLAHMLADTRAPIIVTQERLTHCFKNASARFVCVDRDELAIAAYPTHQPQRTADTANLAYCIYTSGSTGLPKGVAMPHRGIVNHILHLKDVMHYTARDRVLQFTSITADGSLQEIFCAWAAGASVVVPAQKAPPIDSFLRTLTKHQISIASVPTAYWHFWVGEMATASADWPASVRLVILGGEKVIAEKFRQWRTSVKTRDVTWMQDYGPTETTVSCTLYQAAPGDGPEDISIGRPNAHMECYILDELGVPVAAGEAGELCIAGRGLARGYLGKPGLTAEKFTPNPFGQPGSRLYRTGDIARYKPDGNIEFLGRRDDQIKVMGHRIELGEIESALLRCTGVRQAAVLARDSATGGKQIVAYVVADAFDEGALREQLATYLPRPMMPSALTALPALPVTGNGKVDRARLSAIELVRAEPTLADATDLERSIAALWTRSTGRAPLATGEDFFLAGGDSLRALSFLGSVSRLSGIEFDVAAFLRAPTIRSLAALLASQLAQDDNAGEMHALVGRLTLRNPLVGQWRRNTSTRRQASHAQRRLWVLDQLQPGTASYSVPLAYRITGAFSATQLDRSLSAIVARHEALRTVLVMADDALWQECRPPAAIESKHLQADGFAAGIRLARQEAARPLDLSLSPLLRSVCIHTADHEVLWLLVVHHVACDACSFAIFWRELTALYVAQRDGVDCALPEPEYQYGDYADWQLRWLAGPDAERQRAFWRERLAGELPLLQLTSDPVGKAAPAGAGGIATCLIHPDLAAAVRTAAVQHATTPFVVMLSAFFATLHRVTGQDQILIGVPVACRTQPEAAGVFGYFTNTLPIRIVFEPQMRFADLVGATAGALADALAHQELPFDEIVDALGLARRGGSNPVFQAMFVMETTPFDEPPRLAAANVEEIVVHSGTAKVDVTCSIRATEQGFDGELEYSLDVLDQARAERLANSFVTLLAAAARDPAAPLAAIAMLSPAEAEGLIRTANSGFAIYQDSDPLHFHVEAQVALTPDAIAIDHGGTTLRYDALNRRANRLARRLIGAGAAPERLIGICMDRSIDMVIAVLATLKAGAGFVPLDPAFPIDRLHAIARDANLLAVITQDKHALALESLPCQLLLVAADKVDATSADEMNLDVAVSADSLAYVFYTSGSTGAPKGVMLDHRCAMNRLEWLRRRYTLAVGDRLIYKTPLVFDVAVWEILGPLMAGATILMADDGAQADVMHIAALLTVPRTVFTHFVPSMLDAYLGAAPPTACPDLRWVSLSGEAVATRVLKRFSEHFAAEFHNLYGQTETSEVAGWEGRVPPSATTVPIGRQIGIYRLYILDAALNPVPPGVPGEICVAGVGGLARGYQGQPMLTAEKFVPNPYAVVPGERLYRTGDVGRLAEDGTIAYVGRTDHQVKVRGCRVEPAEVEAVLCLHSSVRSCAVVARHDPDGDIQLVAYVVGDAPSEAELGRHVEKYLPRYMVPSAFIILDALPVTPSGKLDRLRLPAPRAMHFAARSKAEPPQTPLETRLAAIWQDVLGIEGIGRGDPFFSIGGNSLKSIQVISRVIAEFNVNVRVSEFWAAPTVEGLASLVEQALMTYVASLSEDEANELLNDRLAEGVGHA